MALLRRFYAFLLTLNGWVMTLAVILALFGIMYICALLNSPTDPPQLKADDPLVAEIHKNYVIFIRGKFSQSDSAFDNELAIVDICQKTAHLLILPEKLKSSPAIMGFRGPTFLAITPKYLVTTCVDDIITSGPNACTGTRINFFDAETGRLKKSINLVPEFGTIINESCFPGVIWDGKSGFFAQLSGSRERIIHYDLETDRVTDVVEKMEGLYLFGFNRAARHLILIQYPPSGHYSKVAMVSWPEKKPFESDIEGNYLAFADASADGHYLAYNGDRDFHLRDLKTNRERVFNNINWYKWSLDGQYLLARGQELDPNLALRSASENAVLTGAPQNISIHSPDQGWQLKIYEMPPEYHCTTYPIAMIPKDCPSAKFLLNQ